MGQYHRVVNLSQRSVINPHELGSGVKLMEFGQDTLGAMAAVWLLLASEAWAGDRIAIVGDYGEPGDLRPTVVVETGLDGTAYGADLHEVGPDARRLLSERWGIGFEVEEFSGFQLYSWCWQEDFTPPPHGTDVLVVNHDRGEVLDPAAFAAPRDLHLAAWEGGNGGVTTALAVLLAAACIGGGRGGGDIHSTSRLVGSWAGDRISVLPAEHADAELADISADLRAVLIEAGEARYDVGDNGLLVKLDPWAARDPLPVT